jgi:hypothetical protein
VAPGVCASHRLLLAALPFLFRPLGNGKRIGVSGGDSVLRELRWPGG